MAPNPFLILSNPIFSEIKEFKPTKAIIIILVLIKVFKTVNIRLQLAIMNSFVYCTFFSSFFENNDCKKSSKYFGPTFLYSLNELNEFQRYVLCRYYSIKLTVLLNDFIWNFPKNPY